MTPEQKHLALKAKLALAKLHLKEAMRRYRLAAQALHTFETSYRKKPRRMKGCTTASARS